MTDIPISAKVECNDGHCGKSTEVIINPVKRKVTHFVVEDSSLPDYSTRLVPVEKVVDMSHDLIRLDCSKDEFIRMEPFVTDRYIDPEVSIEAKTYWGADSYVAPLVINDSAPNIRKEEHVPVGELAVHRGMHVDATDGRAGTVDELVVDSEGEVITHMLLRKGHLWGKKDVAVPVTAIEDIYKDTVILNIDKKAIKELPTVSVKRHSD
ncbi:MAG: PRC-barrel domain-containing protein [Anaerolineaceae bacterium]|nr:MAG: PRC-barrel domain-containing protein [Anaerolineaceae bacterium]